MHRLPLLIPAAAMVSCQSYAPAPVDLTEHARVFERRHEPQSRGGRFDLTDGISREEGRGLALTFHPDCRLARLRAGVAKAGADNAGRLADPVLGVDVERILETVPHRWLVGGALELTLPLSGRLDAELDVARREELAALLDARIAEQEVVLAVDRAWVTWSARRQLADAAADMLARVEGLEAIALRLAEAGELTRPEARTFTLERIARADELIARRTDAVQAEMAVMRAIGLHPAAPVTLHPATELDLQSRPARSLAAFCDSPAGRRLAVAHGIREDRLALEIARQWPDLALAPGFAEEDAQPRATFGVALPLPLWNRNSRAIATADAERAVAAEALRSGLEQFYHDVTIGDRRYDIAVERRSRIERELVPLANRQLEDSRALAENGTLDPLLLLDAVGRAHDAGVAEIEAVLEQALRAADLAALTWIPSPAPGATR